MQDVKTDFMHFCREISKNPNRDSPLLLAFAGTHHMRMGLTLSRAARAMSMALLVAGVRDAQAQMHPAPYRYHFGAYGAYDVQEQDPRHPNQIVVETLRSFVQTPDRNQIAVQSRRKHLQKHYAKKMASKKMTR